MTGKQKKVSVTIDKDTRSARKEAQRILDQKIEEKIGKSAAPQELRLKDTVDLYLAAQKEVIKPSTYGVAKNTLPKLARIIGEDVLIGRLNAPYVMSKIRAETDKPVTINWRIKEIKKIIRWAYGQDLIESKSWLDKLAPVKDDRKARIEDKYLEPEELQKLLDAIHDLKHKALTQFLVLTGCRIGEALALTMDDIDGDYIHITKGYSWHEDLLQDTPKTAESNRDIYIQPELADFLRQYKRDRLQWQLVEGIRTDLLFFNSSGDHLGYLRYYRHLRSASASIGHEITPHALRHTHASMLAAAGMSYDAIARRLGHAGDGVTKEVYLHVTRKLREADAEAMRSVRIL
jgi:integrase